MPKDWIVIVMDLSWSALAIAATLVLLRVLFSRWGCRCRRCRSDL